jgi:Trypsin-like peptidase domain
MDIEKLNKSQIVLLTLLVSFVTSIATGIVTVSLMQQAPPAVAETVNRVIQNTIEEVATSTKGQAAASVVTQEKTVVVNELDLISQAVGQASPSIVRLYSADQTQFLGLGVIINASGTIATDVGALAGAQNASMQLGGGDVQLAVTSRDQATGLAFLTPATTTASWKPAVFAQNMPALGSVVVAMVGIENPKIAQGIVTQVLPADPTTHDPGTIVTDVDSSVLQLGSVIIDTDGNVVGVSTAVSRASSPSGFVPASSLGETNNQN